MIRINLLPVEEAERAAERRTNLALGSLVLGIMVFVFVVAHVWQTARFASANRQLRRINADIAALAGPYADVTRMEQQKKELSEKLRVISQLEAKKVGPVRILAGLSEATPEKLWLTEYADAGGKLKLTGFGADEQTVADFLRKLDAKIAHALKAIDPVLARYVDGGRAPHEHAVWMRSGVGLYLHLLATGQEPLQHECLCQFWPGLTRDGYRQNQEIRERFEYVVKIARKEFKGLWE